MHRTSSAVVSFSRLKGKGAFLLLIVAFMLGMLYGVLLIQPNGTVLEQLQILTGDMTGKGTLLQNFFSSCASALFFLFIPYLLGYSAIGQPLIALVPFFKGLGLGAFLGSLYASHGFLGMGYSLLIVIPSALLLLFAILIGCREAIRLANLLFWGFFGKEPVSPGVEPVRLYNMKFLVLFGIAIISAAVSAVSMWLFSGLFQF